MGKVYNVLFALFAASVVRGFDFHGYKLKETPSTEVRQSSSQVCPDTYYTLNGTGTYLPGKTTSSNYQCVSWCYYNYKNVSVPLPKALRGLINKAQDFTACGPNSECLNGKCFNNDCVKRCQAMANDTGTKLTNIGVDTANNRPTVNCYLDGEISGFLYDGQCKLQNQLDFEVNSVSDVYIINVTQPDAECKRRFGDSGVSARLWNNGCYFRCVINGNVLPTRYLQPRGSKCADNYSCINSTCQRNTCINVCNTLVNGFKIIGEQHIKPLISDIIQEDTNYGEAGCFADGFLPVYYIAKLPSPLKCEASYPDDESADGGGRPVSGNTIITFENISGGLDFGNTNMNNNGPRKNNNTIVIANNTIQINIFNYNNYNNSKDSVGNGSSNSSNVGKK